MPNSVGNDVSDGNSVATVAGKHIVGKLKVYDENSVGNFLSE